MVTDVCSMGIEAAGGWSNAQYSPVCSNIGHVLLFFQEAQTILSGRRGGCRLVRGEDLTAVWLTSVFGEEQTSADGIAAALISTKSPGGRKG